MSNVPSGIFMYGFPAAGKTTFCKNFIKNNPDVAYISADDIRKDHYGSQDTYGNPEEMFKWILDMMIAHIDAGKDFIYDATNLKLQYRLDFLENEELKKRNWNKYIIRINTPKDTCLGFHAKRDRDIPQEKLLPYYEINQPPTMDEGWDAIEDVASPYCNKSIYMASPFFTHDNRKNAMEAAEILRSRGYSVYLPLEHKILNAWDYPNYEWGKMVFQNDVDAINDCDVVVVLSYGRESTAGTNWEAGFAYGIGKKVVVVEMPTVKLMSLMLANGRVATLKSIQDLKLYDFEHMPRIVDNDMEQK